jgi:hypothetical protein
MTRLKVLEIVLCRKQQPYEPFVAASCSHCAVYQKSSLPPRKFVEQMVQVIEEDRKELN